MGRAIEALEFTEDSLGIPLIAMGFQATNAVARMELWEGSARIPQRLAEEQPTT